ncbi:hypothetical protein JZ751_011695, partial [Albula glossodonta]
MSKDCISVTETLKDGNSESGTLKDSVAGSVAESKIQDEDVLETGTKDRCFFECSGPLGMEGGIISNQQITASSTHRALFGLQKWYPYFARLNKKGLVNAWSAAENDRWPWIQSPQNNALCRSVTRTHMSIREHSVLKRGRRTAALGMLGCRKDTVSTQAHTLPGGPCNRDEEVDSVQNVAHPLSLPVFAVGMGAGGAGGGTGNRMAAQAFWGTSVRQEGRNLRVFCTGSTTESFQKARRRLTLGFGRLSTEGCRTGPSVGAVRSRHINLQRRMRVTGLITQGAKRIGSPEYVKSYKVAFSDDGKTWRTYKVKATDEDMIFRGNVDNNTPSANSFTPPIEGQYVRIYPQVCRRHCTLRMELLGCELTGCSEPMGMKTGHIQDYQITSSSVFQTLHMDMFSWEPGKARLDKQGKVNAWTSGHNDQSQWLQVRTHRLYSIFQGNFDNETHRKNVIDPPIYSRFVRILPWS